MTHLIVGVELGPLMPRAAIVDDVGHGVGGVRHDGCQEGVGGQSCGVGLVQGAVETELEAQAMRSIGEAKEAERSLGASDCVDNLAVDVFIRVACASACASKEWDSAAV